MRLFILSFLLIATAQANPRQKAWKLHNRLTGTPPSALVLNEMVTQINGGNYEGAAEIAVQNPLFYNVVLKNWIKPWSNRLLNPRVPLNDYVATVIGVIRDDLPFDQVLYSDHLYTLEETEIPVYSIDDNEHYLQSELRQLNLMEKLTRQVQSAVTGLPQNATAGVITTRASGESFFFAGTNRRVNRFLFINYLCRDYEDVHDTTVPDFRVRRDVERDPGGDTRTYQNSCKGCHAGQDALGGAYAYYDWKMEGGEIRRLEYTPGQVRNKMNHNNYYPNGYVTTNDSWINLWAQGQNANLGWRGPVQGSGVRSLGMMLARSRAFSECMAQKVYKLVCIKDAAAEREKTFVAQMATEFEANNTYNMKDLIVKTSAGCVANED